MPVSLKTIAAVFYKANEIRSFGELRGTSWHRFLVSRAWHRVHVSRA